MLKQNETNEPVVEIPEGNVGLGTTSPTAKLEIKPQEEIKLPEVTPEVTHANTMNDQGIEVNTSEIQRVKQYPLVVKLPEGASNAQIAYAKMINAYAYQNPEKFAIKKDAMIKKLLSLKNAPDPVVGKLKINNSGI